MTGGSTGVATAEPTAAGTPPTLGGEHVARKTRGRRIAHIGLRVAAVCIAIGLFARTILAADLARVAALVTKLGPRALVPFAPFAAIMLLETLGWTRLLALLGVSPRFFTLLRIRISSEAFLLSLPGGSVAAEAAKVVLAKSRLGLSSATTMASVAQGKPLSIGALSVYLFIGVGISSLTHHGAPRFLGSETLGYGLLVAAIVLGASAAVLAFALRGSLAERLFELLLLVPSSRARAWLAVRRMGFTTTDAQMSTIGRASSTASMLAAAPLLLGLFLQGLETWILFRLLGARIPFEEVICLDASMAVVRSVAFLLPAGLGLTDLSYVAALGALGVPDHATLGAAFAVLKRAKDIVVIAIGYALLWSPRTTTRFGLTPRRAIGEGARRSALRRSASRNGRGTRGPCSDSASRHRPAHSR